ncbi:MAG: hypothetical protein LUC39_05835 [Clostridiales bacterium]|nr:hypothetical protein [Clostridiales bacterium]
MSKKRRPLPGAGTPGKGRTEKNTGADLLNTDFTTPNGGGQGMRVSDFLMHGEENAIPAPVLALLYGYDRDTRKLRKEIDHEREQGELILASEHGYYLPSDNPTVAIQEIKQFVQRQDARLRSNRRALKGCKAILREHERQEVPGQVGPMEGGGEDV